MYINTSKHDFHSRRHVPHGLGPALSGGGAGSSRHRRRLLDRPHAGDQPRVPQVRQRHRLRHLRRDQARREGLSGRAAAHAQGRLAGLHAAQAPVDLRDWCQWWNFKFGADWRRPYGPRSSISGLDDHPVVHVAYRDAEAYATVGRQGTADRSRVGVRGARRARRRRVRLGRRVHARRTADGEHLAGRTSRTRTSRSTATSARRR